MDGTRDCGQAFAGDEGPLPDLRLLSAADLNGLIATLVRREQALGASQSLVQGKLELLRAERIARLRRSRPDVDARLVAEAVLRRWLLDTP